MDTLTTAPFDRTHLSGAHALSRAVNWPHRAEDWEMFLSLSQGVVILDGDRVVATALATPFGGVATANMIIVDAALRGAGLGRRVMEAAMARVTSPEWRLIATQDGLPLYRKLGFEAYGEIVQHQGLARPETVGLVLPDTAGPADLDTLCALDHAATGMDRRTLLVTLLQRGRVFLMRENGTPTAFAALRSFGRGEVLGPVIARDEDEARALMFPLIASAEGRFLRVDTPVSAGLADWLAAQGLAHAGGGILMRKGASAPAAGPQTASAPATGPQTAFALAAQAFG